MKRAGRNRELVEKRMRQRRAAERRFRLFGLAGVLFGAFCLVLLLTSVIVKGYTAFTRTVIELEVYFDPEALGIVSSINRAALEEADYYTLAVSSIQAQFPGVTDRREKRELKSLLSSGAVMELRELVLADPSLPGATKRVRLTASSDLDQLHKGNARRDIEESRRKLSDLQLGWYDELRTRGQIKKIFNISFFLRGDSRSPELAGIGGAIVGSVFTLIVCLLVAFPVGVAAAVYLEEFASKNRWTEVIEVNINNLAAVPSIIFGLLGLAIVLNVLGLPRGTPIAGGVVLALMTLPTIIIASRAALRAVPPSIREGALAMGASPVQVVVHHVLPLALPGTLTGTILGLARALGETAPLLMIGMVAFIVDVPGSLTDSSAVLPVQIYLWAESAERGFVEKTSAAIVVILSFLMFMNIIAVYLRHRFERRW